MSQHYSSGHTSLDHYERRVITVCGKAVPPVAITSRKLNTSPYELPAGVCSTCAQKAHGR